MALIVWSITIYRIAANSFENYMLIFLQKSGILSIRKECKEILSGQEDVQAPLFGTPAKKI